MCSILVLKFSKLLSFSTSSIMFNKSEHSLKEKQYEKLWPQLCQFMKPYEDLLQRIQKIKHNYIKDNFTLTSSYYFLSKSDRDAVMWLNAFGASTHHVYFGTSQATVSEATPTSAEYSEKIISDGNVYYLSRSLKPGSTYYWRVDGEIDDNTTYKGDVWSFRTK